MPLSGLVAAKLAAVTVARPCSKIRPARQASSLPSARSIYTTAMTMKTFAQSMAANTLHSLLPSCAAPVVFKRTKMFYSHKNPVSDLNELFIGNKEYMENMSEEAPGLLASLAIEGQKPPFMLVDCSDSRVNEGNIFAAQPGTIFTAGNIANRFDEQDMNSNAVLAFAVETLRVKHVVVLGHYGCGGVAESMMPLDEPYARPADIAVQAWIRPIREIYWTSNRPEIVAHREKCRYEPMTQPPHLHDPAFRALVEENVKSNVSKIANSFVIRDHYADVALSNSSNPDSSSSSSSTTSTLVSTSTSNSTTTSSSTPNITTTTTTGPTPAPPTRPITEVYIHGWVYDVENGRVSDLGVSVGPPGKKLPPSPFPVISAPDS